MKTNFKTTAWLSGICFTLLLVMVLSAWLAHQQRSQAFKAEIQHLHRVTQQHIEELQVQLQQDALIAARSVLANSSIQNAIVDAAESYQNQPDDQTTLTSIRNRVLPELDRHWQALQPFSVQQLHLHLGPDAFTLLRAHRPERHSDRLTTVRPLVMSVLSGGDALTALEVGRHGFGVRAVVQVQDAEQHTVGALEVGLGISQLIFERQQLLVSQGITDSGVSVLLSSKLTSVLHPAEQEDYLTDSQWLHDNESETQIKQWLRQGLIPGDITRPQMLQFQQDGQHFLVSVVPWYGYQQPEDQPAPVVLLGWHDISQMVLAQQQRNSRIWALWLASTLLSLVLIVFFARRLQKSTTDSITAKQKELYWSEQRLDALFRLSPLPILLNRMTDGAFVEANPAMEQLVGYSQQELSDLSYWDLIPENYTTDEQEQINLLKKNGRYGPFRKQYRHKDGHLIDIELNGLRFENPAGEPMIWTIVQDLTERQRIEQMKNEFISTLSHELRTPLTSVSGALGLVLAGRLGEIPEKAEKILSTAYRNSQRLALLINDLLDIEKIAAGQLHFDMQVQPVAPILEQALEENKAYGAKRSIKIELCNKLSEVHVRVDEQRLKQVLANLLSNAIKFSPDDSTVTIDTRADESYLTVSVIDQGSGIPDDFQPKIFQKFAQANTSDTRPKGGTGLGLAISKQLIEHMQGRIGFDSTEGEGTCFYIQLPLSKRAGKAPSSKTPESDKTRTTPHRILVVEDDPDVAKRLKIMLEGVGYKADIYHFGLEALEALQNRHYDLISLDLVLPDISGLDIIRRIRARAETADIPIVVMSAKVEQGRLALRGETSGIEWLAKPIELAKLMNTIQRRLPDPKQARILHVEDDADLHAVIQAMATEHMAMDNAPTLELAQNLLTQNHYDAVLLDIGLPDGSGWDLIPAIKEKQPSAAIIVLTGEDVSREAHDNVEEVLTKSRLTTEQLIHLIEIRIHSGS